MTRVLVGLAAVIVVCLGLLAYGVRAAESDKPADVTPHYEFDVVVDPANKRLRAQGTFTIAPTKEPREQLRIAIADTLGEDLKLEITAPADLAGPVRWGPKETFGRTVAWNITPKTPVPANTAVTFRFSYSGRDKSDAVNIFQLAPDSSFANGAVFPWYPQIILPVILNPPVMGSMRLRFLNADTVVAPGIETTTAADRRERFRRFEMRRPSHFGFAGAQYRVRKGAGGLPYSTYLIRDRQHVIEAAPRIERMMRLFQEWFGPYPMGEVAITEVAGTVRFGSTMESILISSSGSLDEAWDDAFYGHEVSHAWFGGIFSTDLHAGPEGGANYAALQLIEALYGHDAARRFRMWGNPGYSDMQSAFGYFRLAAAGFDQPLVKRHDTYAQQQLGYSKGMLVWDMLRRHLGDERMNRVWRAVFAHRAWTMRPWTSVVPVFSRAAGEDLTWFFHQWLERTGAPDLSLTWTQDGGRVRGKIVQTGDVYRLDVPVVVRSEDGSTVERKIAVRERETAFDIDVRGRVRAVDLDPDYTILRWTPEFRALSEALVDWTRAYVSDEFAPGIAALKQALAKPMPSDPHGATFVLHYSLARLYSSTKEWSASVAEYRAALDASPSRIDIAPWMMIRMADAAGQARDRATQIWALDQAIALDAKGPPSMLGEAARLRRARKR
jgi:hypothetical protein